MRCPTDHFIWQLFVFQANSRWVAWCMVMRLCNYYSCLFRALPFPGDCRRQLLFCIRSKGSERQRGHITNCSMKPWKDCSFNLKPVTITLKQDYLKKQKDRKCGSWQYCMKGKWAWGYPYQGIPLLKKAWAPYLWQRGSLQRSSLPLGPFPCSLFPSMLVHSLHHSSNITLGNGSWWHY